MNSKRRKTIEAVEVADVTGVIDPDGAECLCVDGDAWVARGKLTVDVADLVKAAEGKALMIDLREIDFVHDEWPAGLRDALTKPKP